MKDDDRDGVVVFPDGYNWEEQFKKLLREIKGRPFTELEALVCLYYYRTPKEAKADGVG